MAKENKVFRFVVKQVDSDTGTFTGVASAYEVLDMGGDIVERGAFARTIKRNPEVPIMWRHEEPIGLGTLEDSATGLVVKGKLTMGVKQAQEALALMKDRVVKGLSIGFTSVKDAIEDGVRHLQEVKLWEVSITPFPMNPAAEITDVKEKQREQKDFTEEYDAIQTRSAGYAMMNALETACYQCAYGDDLLEDRMTEAGASIDQFKTAFLEWMPKMDAMMMQRREAARREGKEGRAISADTRNKIQAALDNHRAGVAAHTDGMNKLMALLGEGSDTAETPASDKADPGPAEPGADPRKPSVTKLEPLLTAAKEMFVWTPSSKS